MELQRGAVGLLVDHETAAIGPQRERFGQGQGPVAVLAQHPVAAGLGAGRGIGADGAPLGDTKALGDQGLDADVVGA